MRDATDPERHAARATLYSATAVPFLYPDDERLGALRDDDAREGVRAAARRLGFEEEAEALLDAVAETDVERLRGAYDDLFGLPSDEGTYPVVPYEAHYTAGAEVNQEQRRIATVVGLMEAFDVEPGEDFHERQDHVAAELELMQVVASQRAVARHEDDEETAGRLAEAEATVLAEHLIDFVPPLSQELEDATDNPVYEAAARLARELVEWDNAAHPEPRGVPTGETAQGVRNGA